MDRPRREACERAFRPIAGQKRVQRVRTLCVRRGSPQLERMARAGESTSCRSEAAGMNAEGSANEGMYGRMCRDQSGYRRLLSHRRYSTSLRWGVKFRCLFAILTHKGPFLAPEAAFELTPLEVHR